MRFPAWKLTLAVGVLAIAGYFAIPSVAGKDIAYTAIGIGATGCMLMTARLNPSANRWGWTLIAAASVCFVLGDGVLDGYAVLLRAEAPFPSVADVLYLSGYPFLFAGVFRIGRARLAPESRENRADAAIVCVGALALFWQLLMGSYAHDDTLGWLGKLVTMAYPVMDLGVVFLVASALLSGAARRRSDQLLVAAVAAMLVADFTYDLLVLHDNYATGNPIDGLYLLSYVVLAVAALHPSVAQPLNATRPLPAADSDSGGAGKRGRQSWVPLVALAGFLSPTILLSGTVLGFDVDVAVLSATSLVLFALVVARLSWLLRRIGCQAVQLEQRGQSLRTALGIQQALEIDLRHQAFHDSLTGLANRALLHDRVEHALAASSRSGATVALCFCDLDGFKAVNDSLGHPVGDELLAIAAKRLASIVRSGDTVARLGGDEFAILLDNVDNPEAATSLAERVVSVLRQPTRIADKEVSLSVSVGVAFAEVGATTDQLLSEADAAMYEAKSSGRDRFAVFESSMRSRLVERMTLINSFRGALEASQFYLEYQPQYCLADGRPEGFEALVRWAHPSLGLVGPYHFIPLAEETGFIVPLGRWILEQACVQAASWPVDDMSALSVSINLSGRQLQDPHLVQDVRNALAFSGLPPQRLVLEITESVLMLNPQHTAQVLLELKRMGARIAVDDFGTGYSSLNYLRQFPVDILKIDKSFIDPLTDPSSEGAAFVKTILRLAADLRLKTTAEGIEHDVQRDTLTELKCDSAQGYLMSHPLSGEATRRLVENLSPVPVGRLHAQ